jgi:hypothetical protein
MTCIEEGWGFSVWEATRPCRCIRALEVQGAGSVPGELGGRPEVLHSLREALAMSRETEHTLVGCWGEVTSGCEHSNLGRWPLDRRLSLRKARGPAIELSIRSTGRKDGGIPTEEAVTTNDEKCMRRHESAETSYRIRYGSRRQRGDVRKWSSPFVQPRCSPRSFPPTFTRPAGTKMPSSVTSQETRQVRPILPAPTPFSPTVQLSLTAPPLVLNAVAILDFIPPSSFHFSFSNRPQPGFHTSFEATALPNLNGSLSYVASSSKSLHLGSSESVSFRDVVSGFLPKPMPDSPREQDEIWLAGKRVDEKGEFFPCLRSSPTLGRC